MRHTIIKVGALIQDRKQLVNFYTKERVGGAPITFIFEDLYNYLQKAYSFNIKVTDIELLLNSHLDTLYFKKGEMRPNGTRAKHDNTVVKSYNLVLSDTPDKVRMSNASHLLNFDILYDTYLFKNKVGEGVRLRATNGKVCFMDATDLEKLIGIPRNEFSLLKGAFISPIFYKAGDISEERNWPIWEDGKVIKNLNLRVFKTIDYNYEINGKQIPQLFLSKRRNLNNDSSYERYQPSYEKYNGYNGYDDDTIDNAFEGDPEATWNVD